MALFHTMIGHIFSYNSEAASLNTRLKQLIAILEVFNSLVMLVNLVAPRITAFELKTEKFLRNISVNCSEFYIVIPLTFLGAMAITCSPRIDARCAEQRLATATLKRILNNHGADSTHEKVCFFP